MRYRVAAQLETETGEEVEIVVQVDGRDIRRWEAESGKSFLQHQNTYTDYAKLAFFAATRCGEFDGSWQEWDARCFDARDVRDPVEVEADARPTRKGRGGRPRSG